MILTGCERSVDEEMERPIIEFVNPFIGTGGHGHTFPGATTPFGMVQLSPDSRLTGWDGCSGYHYSDSFIYGFSHTHLSGTGVSDYGDLLFMPLNGGRKWDNGSDGKPGYRSAFSHENEKASPGFYSVYLEDPQVQVNLTATPRTGYHQYIFNEPKQPSILLDLVHRDEVLSASLEIISPTRIEGHRRSKAWASDQHIYFAAEFSAPITEHFLFDNNSESQSNKIEGKYIKSLFQFLPDTDTLEIKIAISAVDMEGAWKNFNAELDRKSFTQIKFESEKSWTDELNKIQATFLSEEEKMIFYTAMYHNAIAPNLYMDTDGRYRDMDLEVHQSEDHTHYTVFSLWDTYRATHPLHTIINQELTVDFIRTFLKKYDSGGILPIWDLSACYTGCMIGNHAISVIADAYMKGIDDYDEMKALESMIHSATQDRLGLDDYKSLGFIAVENEAESVSKTLEYAYNDWCIATMAKALERTDVHKQFTLRSLNYRNLFDPESGFFRGRMRNTWQAPFDPFEVNNNYTEANAWQYGFYVPHDMNGFISLHRGKENLEKKLDELFAAQSETTGRDQADITGLIGQYAHGNEPSHHIAYLYNYLNKPWKTQRQVRQIMSTLYTHMPDGISGNEDCGQMSAWYIYSALGFYPVTPGSTQYIIGSPLVASATFNLENGNTFNITASNNSKNNIYIQSIKLNGEPYEKSYIEHADIMMGGKLHFSMGDRINTNWGSNDQFIPISLVDDQGFIPPPFIRSGKTNFVDETRIELDCVDPLAKIYYRIDDGIFQSYTAAILINKSCTLQVYAERDVLHSDTLSTVFHKIDGRRSIEIKSQYANQYHAGGKIALIDGIRGTRDFRTGTWQGYEGQDVECIVDLGSVRHINSVSCGFLQDHNSWIFMPQRVEYYFSVDGTEYQLLGNRRPSISEKLEGAHIEYLTVRKGVQGRYIKMIARGLIKCPEWHKGYEYHGDSWVFADEIVIE